MWCSQCKKPRSQRRSSHGAEKAGEMGFDHLEMPRRWRSQTASFSSIKVNVLEPPSKKKKKRKKDKKVASRLNYRTLPLAAYFTLRDCH
jgi:hypothetical protein